jgi:hypothetical protein
MVNPTAGGIDAEPDDVYLSRLTDELTLLAPRPILPVDFAIMARDVTGVTRATALDGYDPTATITGRTGTTTSGSPNVTAIAASMTGITAGQAISGAGIPAGTYVISVNAGASTLVMSKNATASATGVALTFTGTFGNAREISVAAVDALGNPVSSAVKGNIDALLQSRREVNFIVNVIDPTYTQIDVTYTVKALTGYDATDVQTRVNQALSNYLSPVNWGGDFFGTGVVTEQTWVNQTTVRYLELAQVINEVPGVDYIVSLTFGIHGGTLGTSDLVLLGPIAMPNPGTMTGTVT